VTDALAERDLCLANLGCILPEAVRRGSSADPRRAHLHLNGPCRVSSMLAGIAGLLTYAPRALRRFRTRLRHVAP
jgi:hypothetical protein